MRSLALLLFLVVSAGPTAGCVSTDPTIFVAPSISAPAATVASSALGTGITGGSFSLDLHLGPRASGESTVTLGEFSILDATMTTPIVTPLDVTGDMEFPVIVLPDSDVDTNFTFGTGNKLLPAATATALCASAGVVIGGSIDDSLAGKQDPVYSDVFMPSGCPGG